MRDVREALMVARNSDGKLVRRPLSPHVQVHRWPLSMALSIAHRISGVGLGIGTLLMTGWLASAASSEDGFEKYQRFLGSAFGILLLFGWTAALVYHLMSGTRHLWMDLGRGFDAKDYENSGLAVLVGTGGLTVLIWLVGLIVW